VLSIVVVIAVGYAQFGSAGEALRDIGTHLLFIHTWWSDTYGSINGVLWTLAVEVEFYVIFPILWLAFKRFPWLTAGAMVAISMLYRVHASQCCYHTSMELLIYNLPGYLDIFASGMISALLYVRWRDSASAWRAPLATAAALAGFIMLALLLQNLWSVRTTDQWSTVWQIYNRTLVGVAFMLMGLGSLLAYSFWQRLVANPVLLFFAAISYNLYLYHQPFARLLLKWHIPPFTGTNEHFDPHWQVNYTIVAFVLTIAQATLVTYLFERPLLRIPMERWRTFMSRRKAAGALSDV
jgi:peptidoglycan/LPS O-acetylase OafA/YrhL